MVYGMGGDLMNPVVELTVMAHEFTHIITDQNAKLEYKGESGALNESFSDIMGISVKKWDNPSYEPWLIGDGVMVDYTNVRNLKNPRMSMDGKDEPRRSAGYYQGYNWYDTSDTSLENDYGGVHRNSGVQNRWYFLLCEGESADNSEFVEGGQPYSMTGIGIEKAMQIAYRTLMQYATSQAQFADIRLCHLQSAKDLYGDNSSEVEAVAKAWDIVGVTDGSTTGIEMVKNSQPALNGQTGKWYTLDGRQLDDQPTKKGLYIHNGNKIVVK
jgi:Zn-dependent metalloprotease